MGIVYEYFSRKILWEPFQVICYTLFFLIVVLYPFNSKAATILLFWYISLWSRIPTLVSDFTKDLDVLDFFSVILAVNINSPLAGVYAGLFAFSLWIISRVFGPDEPFAWTITESIAFFFAGFFSPIVYSLSGHNLLLTMYIFTAIRYFGIFILVAIFFPNFLPYTILGLILGIPVALVMNTFMITFLAPFFGAVFETGLKFNFPLFFFAIILTVSVHYITKYMVDRAYFEKNPRKKPDKKTGNIILNDNMKNYPEFY